MSLSTWVDKSTGTPKTTIAEMSEGINKSGHAYQITNTDSTLQLDEAIPAGTIIPFTMTRGEVDKSGK